MSGARKFAIAAALLAVIGATAGCGEKPQVIAYEQGKYQGKPDSKPWQDAPTDSLYTTSKWNKDDKASWESALRARSQNQNEYVRIGN